MGGRLSWIKKHKPFGMTVAAVDEVDATEYLLHWDKDNLLEYFNSRCRAVLAAAFSEGPGLPHPWDRSHWHSIAAAVGKTFSLYAQAEMLHNNLPNESGDPWRLTVLYNGHAENPLKYTFGEHEGKWTSEPRIRVTFSPQSGQFDATRSHCELALEIKSDRGRNAIYTQFCDFLEEELKFQLGVGSFLKQCYPRENFGRSFPVGNEVYWDVRVRFTDFLRRFLNAYRCPQFGEPDPFTVFFLSPLARCSQNLKSRHTPSGLFGFRYILDDGQRKYIEENNDNLLSRLDSREQSAIMSSTEGLLEIEKGIVPLPFGVCSEVYLRSCAARPHKVQSVVGDYEYKDQRFTTSEKALLGDSTLMEIPIYTIKETLSSNFPDGPEIVLCVCLRNGHQHNMVFGGTDTIAGRVFARHLEPVSDSSFRPEEPGLVIETSQRIVSKYIQSAPISGDMGLIGNSNEVADLRKEIRICSEHDLPVMIRGDSGTGKELIANAIHDLSKRGLKEFKATTCGGLSDDDKLKSELFGHVPGAFTGAKTARQGLVALADGGTIFLDEIADMSLHVQGELMRFLETKKYKPLGSDEERDADVRIITATNRSMQQAVKEQKFREDLLYRLLGYPIVVPSLRERKCDIVVLARHFLGKLDQSSTFTEEAESLLQEQPWKQSNVRQLKNFVAHVYNKEKHNVQHFGKEEVLRCLETYQNI